MLAYKPFFGILCSFAPLDALIICCAICRKHLPRVFQPARYGLYALALALHHGAAKRKAATLDAAKQKQRRPHHFFFFAYDTFLPDFLAAALAFAIPLGVYA